MNMAGIARDPDCIFCKIVEKNIPADIVAEGDDFTAIRDINPQAPTHILVMPKSHVPDISQLSDGVALGELFQSAARIAREVKLDSFRLVVNTGAGAGQTVHHLHIHLLGGRAMHWPPG